MMLKRIPMLQKGCKLWIHWNADFNMPIGIWTCDKTIKKYQEKAGNFLQQSPLGESGERESLRRCPLGSNYTGISWVISMWNFLYTFNNSGCFIKENHLGECASCSHTQTPSFFKQLTEIEKLWTVFPSCMPFESPLRTPLLTGAFQVPARIHVALADAASEEALAPVTAGRSVVLPGGSVPTYGTQTVDPVVCGIHTCCLWGRTICSKKKGVE